MSEFIIRVLAAHIGALSGVLIAWFLLVPRLEKKFGRDKTPVQHWHIERIVRMIFAVARVQGITGEAIAKVSHDDEAMGEMFNSMEDAEFEIKVETMKENRTQIKKLRARMSTMFGLGDE